MPQRSVSTTAGRRTFHNAVCQRLQNDVMSFPNSVCQKLPNTVIRKRIMSTTAEPRDFFNAVCKTLKISSTQCVKNCRML